MVWDLPIDRTVENLYGTTTPVVPLLIDTPLFTGEIVQSQKRSIVISLRVNESRSVD